MGKFVKRFLSFFVVFLFLFALMMPVQAVAASVGAVTLNKKAATIYVGDTLALKATVRPAGASDATLTWTTKKASVATVDQAGLVTAVGAGKTTITAKAENGKKASCVVTVKVRVDGVALSKSETTIKKGKSEKLAWTVSPSDASNKGVTFSSSAKSIASVDKKGKVTAKKAGTAVITVKTKDGGFTAQMTVSVETKPVAAIMITLSPTSATLGVGEAVSLVATVSPADATDKAVTWTTSRASVATVNANGLVTGVGLGSATITAKSANGKSATCAVTVSYSAENLDALANRVIAIVNQRRAENGLPPLVRNEELMAACAIRAKEIEVLFDHTRPDGSAWSTVSPLAKGENVAYGQASPEAVMAAWMNSQGHRENILRNWFQTIGVGVHVGANGRLHWVQLFGGQ